MFVGKMSLDEAAVIIPSDDMVKANPLRRILAKKDSTAGADYRERSVKTDPFPKVEDIVDQLSDRIGYRDGQSTAIS